VPLSLPTSLCPPLGRRVVGWDGNGARLGRLTGLRFPFSPSSFSRVPILCPTAEFPPTDFFSFLVALQGLLGAASSPPLVYSFSFPNFFYLIVVRILGLYHQVYVIGLCFPYFRHITPNLVYVGKSESGGARRDPRLDTSFRRSFDTWGHKFRPSDHQLVGR